MNGQPSELYKLALNSQQLSHRWFGDTGEKGTGLTHMTLAMCGEVGEVANVVKKVDRGSLKLGDASTDYELAMELADVFVYFLNICALLKIDPQQIYNQKQAENERRFVDERRRRESDGPREVVDGIVVTRKSNVQGTR